LLSEGTTLCIAQEAGIERKQFEEIKAKAEKGEAAAQYDLGSRYFFGIEVPKNPVEAVEWFRKAAKQGHGKAQFQLGACYGWGYGVVKDPAEGAKWYRMAAEQGEVVAQNDLGFCYSQGKGVTKDYVEAHKWFNIASAQGNYVTQKMISSGEIAPVAGMTIMTEDPKDSMSRIEQFMTRNQIAEAQRLAREFVPRKKQADSSPSSDGNANDRPSSTGTGFFITEDGFLITNEHVVRDSTQIRLLTSTGYIFAKVVKVDAANDLALLKAEGRFAALPVAASRGVKLGGTVATVGFPNIGLQGFAPKLVKGEIASLSGAQDGARYFQISVPVQPGNSGLRRAVVASQRSASLDTTGTLTVRQHSGFGHAGGRGAGR
jgi:TPR repeat protein